MFGTTANMDMQLGEGVQLPFPTTYFYWMNGSVLAKEAGDARYFGGWATNAETYENVLAETGIEAIPGLTKIAQIGRNNGVEFETYITRVLTIAPIEKRERWVTSDSGAQSSNYQLLAYLAYRHEKTFSPWGPVVLSAKGNAAKYLKDALAKWGASTQVMRRDNSADKAKPVSWNAFYIPLGTFEKAPEIVSVGKVSKSPITPCHVYLPTPLTLEFLTERFVGDTGVAICKDLKEQAGEWLHAWDKQRGNRAETAQYQDEPQAAAAPQDDNPPF